MLLGKYLDPDVYKRTLNVAKLLEATDKVSRRTSNAVSAGVWINKLSDLNARLEDLQVQMGQRMKVIDEEGEAPGGVFDSGHLYELFKFNKGTNLEEWMTAENIPTMERFKEADTKENRDLILADIREDKPQLHTFLLGLKSEGCMGINRSCGKGGFRCTTTEGEGTSDCLCNLFTNRCFDPRATYRRMGSGSDAVYVRDPAYARMKVQRKLVKEQIMEATKMLKIFHSK